MLFEFLYNVIEFFSDSVETGGDSAWWGFGDESNFAEGEVVVVEEVDKGEFVGWQVVEGLAEEGGELIGGRTASNRAGNRGRIEGEGGSGAAAQVVEGEAVGDAVKPRGEGGLSGIVAMELVDGSQQGVLCQFFGVLGISGHSNNEFEDPRGVLLQQLLLGSGLTSL